MSGRTDRRNPRHDQRWVLSFDLPPYVTVVAGQKYPGLDNLVVGPGTHVEITGVGKSRLIDQMIMFLHIVAHDGLKHLLNVYIVRKDGIEPLRSFTQRPAFQVQWSGRNMTMIHRRPSPGNITIESMRAL